MINSNVFIFEHIGSKKIQEDKYLIFSFQNIKCFFVFDGHGYKEKEISLVDYFSDKDFFKKKMIKYFMKHELNINNLKNFFNNLDDELMKKKINSGLCFSALIIKNNLIYILTLGDTLLYIFNKTKLKYKTEKHNLNNVNELYRVKQCNKNKYIKNNRYKKLSMLRSLGDYDCKDLINNPIIPTPDIKIIPYNKNYIFLLATDGIELNYDINELIYLFDKDNNNHLDIVNYCEYINSYNIKSYTCVDNVLFILISMHQFIMEKNLKTTTKNKTFNKIINEDSIYYNILSSLY